MDLDLPGRRRGAGVLHGEGLVTTAFPSQSDAENWFGEALARLTDLGVDAVNLFHEGRQVYGPMSLRAAESRPQRPPASPG